MKCYYCRGKGPEMPGTIMARGKWHCLFHNKRRVMKLLVIPRDVVAKFETVIPHHKRVKLSGENCEQLCAKCGLATCAMDSAHVGGHSCWRRECVGHRIVIKV